jgi:hypothetical protein
MGPKCHVWEGPICLECGNQAIAVSNEYAWEERIVPSRSTNVGPLYHRVSSSASRPVRAARLTPRTAPTGTNLVLDG